MLRTERVQNNGVRDEASELENHSGQVFMFPPVRWKYNLCQCLGSDEFVGREKRARRVWSSRRAPIQQRIQMGFSWRKFLKIQVSI